MFEPFSANSPHLYIPNIEEGSIPTIMPPIVDDYVVIMPHSVQYALGECNCITPCRYFLNSVGTNGNTHRYLGLQCPAEKMLC